ncbi:hypothetical protein M8494_27075 [Serratia ureilytica]
MRNWFPASCRAGWRWGSTMRCTNDTAVRRRAGQRLWNFNRYHLRAGAWRCGSKRRHPAGAVQTRSAERHGGGDDDPVVAALVNAIADATGHRFRDLPVRAENIREVQ